jgi:hypothetical protein
MTNGRQGPTVKVYVSKPEQGGLVRAQDDEIVLYEESLNYRCMNKEDFDKLINYCFNPDQNNEFEKTRQNIKKAPIRYRKKVLKNVVYNYQQSFINQKTQGENNE